MERAPSLVPFINVTARQAITEQIVMFQFVTLLPDRILCSTLCAESMEPVKFCPTQSMNATVSPDTLETIVSLVHATASRVSTAVQSSSRVTPAPVSVYFHSVATSVKSRHVIQVLVRMVARVS